MTITDLFTMQTPAICREPSAECFSRDVRTERMLRPWAQWFKDNWEVILCAAGIIGCFAYLMALSEFHW